MKDYEDDDLRTFIDNLNKVNKQEENEEAGTKKPASRDNDEIEKFSSALDISNDVRDLISRVEKLEVLNYGLWLMLEKKGFTHDEYNAALAEAKENIIKKDTSIKDSIACPKCGRLLQTADVFGIKCIYCGYESNGNPYQIKSNDIKLQDVPEEKEYNVEDDLRFDEL